MSATGTVSPLIEQQERSSRWTWGLIIIGLLLFQIISCVIAAWLAIGSEATAVVPNYHQKALDWDKQQALLAASEKLNWQEELAVTPLLSAESGYDVVLGLKDSENQPVQLDVAVVQATSYHGVPQTIELELVSLGRGHYSTQTDQLHPGMWELIIKAQRGADQFTRTLTYQVPASSATSGANTP